MMNNVIHSQGYVFLTTLYGGMIIGFIYDLYRIFRYFFKPKKVLTFIEDLIFWIFVALVALIVIIFSNWGELRGYVFLGFLLGAFLYNKFLSKIVITLLVKIIKLLGGVLRQILGLVLLPFKLIGKRLYKPYTKAKIKARERYIVVKRKSKLPFRFFKDIKKYTKTIILKKK